VARSISHTGTLLSKGAISGSRARWCRSLWLAAQGIDS
jgi:hypothetical protein